MIQDRRKHFRESLASEYLPHYDALCGLLDEKWQPYAGKRTIEQQSSLYEQGRSLPGEVVTDAQGIESAHCHGCATDWTIFDNNGRPTWLHKNDPLWDEYTTAIWKVGGLRSGAEFKSDDIDHNELQISGKWKDYK